MFLPRNQFADRGFGSDCAARQVNKLVEFYVFSEEYISSDALIVIHSRTIFPLSFSDWSAASRSLTTRNPARPSLKGVRSFLIQSMKYSSSSFKASACSTRGAHTSPER